MPGLREARMEDLEALGRIAYATGYFGASAAAYFPSPSLFRDLWIKPYLAENDGCNLVAEEDGQILGYVIGTPDLRAYQTWMLGYLPRVVMDVLLGRYPGALQSLPYLLRMARYPAKPAPLKAFPAQLHINLLPEARGKGLGQRLLLEHLACLKGRGVAGVQLSTSAENTAAVGLYAKLGFGVYHRWSSPLWEPWLGRAAEHLTMTCPLG